MNSVYDIVCSRRTIRRFLQKKIPNAILEKLINAARLAPSGSNLQPCEYIIVDDSKYVEQTYQCVQWAGYIAPQGNPPEGERPVCYIIVLVNEEQKKMSGDVDAAAAIENMILTAWECGIGSCWMGSVNRDKIRKLFEGTVKKKDYKKSEKYFQKSIGINRQKDFYEGLADNYLSIGHLSRETNKTDEAKQYYLKAITAFEKLGLHSKIDQLNTWINELEDNNSHSEIETVEKIEINNHININQQN